MHKETRYNNYREILDSSAKKFPENTAFIKKNKDGSHIEIKYPEFRERCFRLASYFIENGLKGERIAVCGKNCVEWIITYMAASLVGVVVPIDKELGGADVENFLTSGRCKAACFQKPSIVEAKDRLILSFEDVFAISGGETAIREEEIEAIEYPKDQMQILLFTSGTTGNSKGVCLTQYNVCSDVYSTSLVVEIKPTDRTMSVLPLHHTYECSLDHMILISRGACITYADSLQKIAKNIVEYKPTLLVVVPALMKILEKRLRKGIADQLKGKYKAAFVNGSISTGFKALPFFMRPIVRKKVRQNLGGNLKLFIVGAAELDTSLIDDFEALGIRTLQGYGLTECAPLVIGNSDFYLNKASIGLPEPGIEAKIDNPNEEGVGEILVKGDNIMLGYYEDPEATAKVFRDGWFCTGDLGCVGKDGEYYIKGRIKNVIVTSNGKNIYPEELEFRLEEHDEVSECIVFGKKVDGEDTVFAKVYADAAVIEEKLGHKPSQEESDEIVKKIVAQVNDEMPLYKRIKELVILREPLERTTTQKIKRFGSNVE